MWLPHVFSLGVTMVGSLTLFVLTYTTGSLPASFLRDIWPDRSDTFYVRGSFLLTILLGAIAATFLSAPTTFQQAYFAGLTWPALLPRGVRQTAARAVAPPKPRSSVKKNAGKR